MQLLQQLLTLISCCCSKLRVLATRAARWLMWKIYYLEVFSHFQSPRIKHQVLFEVGIQLENPEMSSDLDFDRKVSIVIALQKYHEKRQRSTTTKRDKKNSEGQIWWNRNCWISFLPCEGRMGTQTTVSQGITTIICCLSGVKTSGQADCLSISSFYCGRGALAVCWLLSFMGFANPPYKFHREMLASEKGGDLTILILRLKAATPLTREGEPLSASKIRAFIQLLQTSFRDLPGVEKAADRIRWCHVGAWVKYPRLLRLWDTLGYPWLLNWRFEQCIGSGLLNFWFVVTCLQHFHKRHCDRPDQSFLRLEVLDLL